MALEQPQASNSQSFLQPQSQKDFTKQVVTAFSEADIPLYKLQHSSIKNLFNSTLGHHCSSESACRKQVNNLASQESERIKKLLTRKPIFLVVDKSDVSGQKYVNVFAGLMEEPNKTYLIACTPLSGNPNSSNICTIVDDCLKKIGITREMFLLLLSDLAKYMLSFFVLCSSGKLLRDVYSQIYFDVSPGNGRQASSEKQNSGRKTNPE